ISDRHCELIVENGQVLVRDLGSDTGTCVNGDLVDEGWLRAGDTLRVGNFEFQFRGERNGDMVVDTQTMSSADGVGSTMASPTPQFHGSTSESGDSGTLVCQNHPANHALWKCNQCGGSFCDTCVLDGTALRVRGAHLCPGCRCLATPIPPPGSLAAGQQRWNQE